MSRSDTEPISAEEAARLIFKTHEPDFMQVGKIRELIRRGELERCEKGSFTTTRYAVAAYLSAEQLRKHDAKRARASRTQRDAEETSPPRVAQSARSKSVKTTNTPRDKDSQHLRGIYRDVLSDYFLSVFSYARARDRSRQFQQRIFHIRVAVLLGLMLVGGWVLYVSLSPPRRPEEAWAAAGKPRLAQASASHKQAATRWIEQNRREGKLLDLLPAHRRPGGEAIRARLRFVGKDGQVRYEDVVLVVQRGEIVREESPDEQDEALILNP